MTGEMSRSDVTPEEYPHYFAIAKAFAGTVEPFDVYQGPYILIAKPKLAKLWLIADEQGGGATVYDSKSERQSDWFPLYTRDPNESYGMAIAAAAKVLQRAPRNLKYRAVLGAHAGRPARLTGYSYRRRQLTPTTGAPDRGDLTVRFVREGTTHGRFVPDRLYDRNLLRQIIGRTSFVESDYDEVLAAVSREGFALAVIDPRLG